MKKLFQQTTCFLLAFVLFAGVIFTHPAQAADNTETELYTSSGWEESIANTAKSYSFTTKNTGTVYVDLGFAQPTTFLYQITNSSGAEMTTGTILATDEYWQPITNSSGEYTIYFNGPYFTRPTVGDFNLTITTFEDTAYLLSISQGQEPASISNKSMTITAGFTDTLKVLNTSGTVTWKSSNTKIATVNNKGVVTAKKKGTCTITATTEDKQTLKCKIKVRENAYKDTKYTNADAPSGKVTAYVYKGSFDSKGNLVCKVRLINNKYNTITSLTGFKINVQNDKKKTVFSYKVGTKSLSVSGYKYKDFTVTIPKASVKKCDLAKGTFLCEGNFIYIK